MKKAIQTFITWFLIVFLAIAATPLVLSQPTSSPQPASPINQLEEAQIVFQDKTLFTIKNNLSLISLQKRQQKIEKRIAEFANNYAVSLDDLEVITMDEGGGEMAGGSDEGLDNFLRSTVIRRPPVPLAPNHSLVWA